MIPFLNTFVVLEFIGIKLERQCIHDSVEPQSYELYMRRDNQQEVKSLPLCVTPEVSVVLQKSSKMYPVV